MNISKLKGKIVEANTTQEAVSKALSIHKTTLYRKLKSDGNLFTIGEMHNLVEILSLSQQEAIDIFLNQKSH